MQVPAILEERISTKTGKPYLVLVIKLTNKYEKLVFLEKAEIALLNLNQSK